MNSETLLWVRYSVRAVNGRHYY